MSQPVIYLIGSHQDTFSKVDNIACQESCDFRPFVSLSDFLSEAQITSVGCLLVDVNLHQVDLEGFIQLLCDPQMTLSTIFLVECIDTTMAVRLTGSGAKRVFSKPLELAELRNSLRKGLAISDGRWQHLQRLAEVEQRIAQLNEEELQVMECLLAGKSNRVIADQLVLSARTVDRRRRALMDKMGVDSLPELCLAVSAVRAPHWLAHLKAAPLPSAPSSIARTG